MGASKLLQAQHVSAAQTVALGLCGLLMRIAPGFGADGHSYSVEVRAEGAWCQQHAHRPRHQPSSMLGVAVVAGSTTISSPGVNHGQDGRRMAWVARQ